MSSRRRIVLDLRAAGIHQWSRRETASGRRIGLGIPQLPSSGSYLPSIFCNHLSTAVQRRRAAGIPQWPSRELRLFKNRFIRHHLNEVGYTVDVAALLFTPERDFLVNNKGQKIKVEELRGKAIVLFIVPIDALYDKKDNHARRPGRGDIWDMIQAYNELQSVGESAVEFVFVPVRLYRAPLDNRQEDKLRHLLSTVPFPATPDVQAREGLVVQTFSLDSHDVDCMRHLPYWVVIDPTNTVVATRFLIPGLFKLFGGVELLPFSEERIWDLEASLRSESRVQLISKWDQLLASNSRDFLLSSNGDKVPISSLKGKMVGLYFCENIPHPPRMQAIKKVYEEARSRGYDFEIVQITFHYQPFNARHVATYPSVYLATDPTVQQCCEDVSWLTLPFKDPSCRIVQRILHCVEETDLHWVGGCLVSEHWVGDSLVLIQPPQADADHSGGALFELSGAEILERWGIKGYPFARSSLYEAEYEVQKRKVTLESLFPRRKSRYLFRPIRHGFQLFDPISQLLGKRVLVLFAKPSGDADFISMLKSEYHAQQDNVAEESKFEVVFVSIEGSLSSSQEFTKDMPWFVQSFAPETDWDLLEKVFKAKGSHTCAAAFDVKGELIAKACHLPQIKEGHKLQFPFIDQDLKEFIAQEVEAMCDISNLY